MRARILSFFLFGILFLTGCVNGRSNNSPMNASAMSQIYMEKNGHIEQLHDYDTPYTVCCKNADDTYTMYVFAAPIQYHIYESSYAMIDNTVVASSKDGFAFENKSSNIKTYFPATLGEPFRIESGNNYMEFQVDWETYGFSEAQPTIFQNMYGDTVSGVIYKRDDTDLVFYPTKAGIKTEIVLKEKTDRNTFSYTVSASASSYVNNKNGYILLKEGGVNQSVIYGPLVQYGKTKQKQMDVSTYINIKEDEKRTVEMTVDESILQNPADVYPVKLDPSFEMYLNKMPDSTVYSTHTVNNYLANYAVIGEHPTFGEGWHYLRFRLNHFMTQPPKNLLSAKYKVKKLYANTKAIHLLLSQPLDQWSSTSMIWDNKIGIKKLAYDYKYSFTSDNWCEIDITPFLQECFSDQSLLTESIGMVLSMQQSKTSDYMIFAASDHTLYTPYLQLEFSKLPLEFKNIDNINE